MTEETTCTQMEEKIPLLVYDELPEAEVPAVQAHLEQCNACRDMFSDLKSSASFLEESTTNLPPLTLSDEERCRILTSILEGASDSSQKRTEPVSGKKPARTSPVIWVILVIVVLGLAALVYSLLTR